MENIEKLKTLSQVDYTNESAIEAFHIDYATLDANEQLVLVNHIMDRYDYSETTEDDSNTTSALAFLKDARFEPVMKVFYEMIENETPENQIKLDKLWEETALLEPAEPAEAEANPSLNDFVV